jgi:hypothetical protein
MFTLSPSQLDEVQARSLYDKLLQQLRVSLDGFGTFDEPLQSAFVWSCMAQAQSLGLRSELGAASYALGAWWLNLGFEQHSPALLQMLLGDDPEPDKLRRMNEWISLRLGHPDEPKVADAVLCATAP